MGQKTLLLILLLLFSSTSFLRAVGEGRENLYTSTRLAFKDASQLHQTHYKTLETVRYLSLYNIPREERSQYIRALNFVVNSLSQNTLLYPVVPLPSVLDPQIIRLDLYNYRIDPKGWDFLFEEGTGLVPQPEQYFHLVVVEKKQKFRKEKWGTRGRDGKYYNTYIKEVPDGFEEKKKQVFAPWADPIIHEQLAKLVETNNPIGRADWFITYALWGKAYYKFFGLEAKKSKLEEFADIVKANFKLAASSIVRGVSDSKIVTHHNRIILRFPTLSGAVGGYWWESNDTRTGIDDSDFLNDLLNPKIQAKEIITTLPNGLQGYALANGDNVLQDVAPVVIAADHVSGFHDPQVWNARNCISCHKQGMIPVDDRVRKLAQKQIVLQIQKTDSSEKKKELEDFFNGLKYDLGRIQSLDKAVYATAVKACNGWTPEENAKTYLRICKEYFQGSISPEKASWEVGYQGKTAQLIALMKKAIGLHHTGTCLLQDPPLSVYRVPWENKGFASLMLYLSDPKVNHDY